jgi:hypothetical protein
VYEGVGCIQVAQDRGHMMCSCKRRNKPTDSIKEWEFLDRMSECQLLKNTSAACS